MSNPFHVGQRVAYVGHKNHDKHSGYQYPEVGSTYTVRSLGELRPELILLMEIDNKRDGDFYEAGFHHSGFRPVVERKTDISIFRAMLNKPTVRVNA